MKRIGILGGTFNPIHNGHLVIAQTALEKLNLDKVIFVPSNMTPHKTQAGAISGKDRYAMVKFAIAHSPHFDACDFEIDKEGPSYSIDTVGYLRHLHPKDKLYFIIGSDNAAILHTWKGIKELTKLVTFIAVYRASFPKKNSKVNVRWISMPRLDISASFLRKQARSGKSIRYFVPESVAIYIEKRGLYRKGQL